MTKYIFFPRRTIQSWSKANRRRQNLACIEVLKRRRKKCHPRKIVLCRSNIFQFVFSYKSWCIYHKSQVSNDLVCLVPIVLMGKHCQGVVKIKISLVLSVQFYSYTGLTICLSKSSSSVSRSEVVASGSESVSNGSLQDSSPLLCDSVSVQFSFTL